MKKCGAVKPGPDAGTAWPRRSQIRFCGETFLRRDEMGGGGTGRHGEAREGDRRVGCAGDQKAGVGGL